MKDIKDIAVALAKNTIEQYVREGTLFEPENLPEELDTTSSGVFVTIRKSGKLRGCIGVIAPTGNSVKADIMMNAVSAATRDPRFAPVSVQELGSLTYSIDILQQPFAVSDIAELDPKSYGVIVRKGSRQGVLLPDIEGVDTTQQQLEIACSKAGIALVDDPEILAFEVIRYGEK